MSWKTWTICAKYLGSLSINSRQSSSFYIYIQSRDKLRSEEVRADYRQQKVEKNLVLTHNRQLRLNNARKS